jgi:anti-sigma regulatory factor (Ser/Thr protein kinase)
MAAGVSSVDGGNELRVPLERSAHAPSEVRRVLAVWLQNVECSDEIKADAMLVASELVTNAVVHARSAPVMIAVFDDGRRRLEVEDAEPDSPRPRPAGERPGGYGLHIVGRISDGWGSHPTAHGKAVWAEILC